ncbi:glycosyltransferase family 4 protein [Beijerinckia indica]|uniref:Glycosyl transferase group 1 n=1 Tax=Beijerinckia indica subsp. indica (strain ATCC 9039 / DSM 1715 / NCIMB 8712) TaxID=395963 RepID=B2IHG9_BEII9|nr:glycosyltransferase family 4 protein [Beijerinckia indica]ACB94490.1 glycosyl transferase group 1 [Beijerinckia indica subsp. indica ATCC 9039]
MHAKSLVLDTPVSIANVAPQAVLTSLQIGIQWRGQAAGGLDRVFHDLVQSLPAQGINVRGLVVGPADVAVTTKGLIQPFAAPDAQFVQRLLGVRAKVDEILSRGEADLVAAHFSLHIAAALDRLRHIPLIMHFHGPWADESLYEGEGRTGVFLKRLIEKYVYRRADRLVVLSHAFGDVLVKNYGVMPDRIRIIPGGVDLDHFHMRLTRQAARQKLGWPTDRPILLSVRRLTERMGLDHLLLALQKIVKAQPDVLLMMSGKGPLAETLQRQTEALGLTAHVRFLGFMPDATLPLAYRAADINVVPSTALEGFGLTAAEALAAGTPSMVTPVGGLPEVVADLSSDLIFASNKVEDLAGGLIDALRGGIRLPSVEACEAYAARFGLPRMAAETAAVYRECI